MFTISIHSRDFTTPELLPGLRWTVERLDWRAVGGPWSARLRAASPAFANLWRLAGLLRCPITISDGRGPAWWGYIHSVELRHGARVVRAGLDELANHVAVRYRSPAPEAWGGEEQRTAYLADADSQRVYGLRQRLFLLERPGAQPVGTPAEAEAARAALLAAHARPGFTAAFDSQANPGAQPEVVVTCRGWWQTLDWQFYSEPRGSLQHTRAGTSVPLGNAAAQTKYTTVINIGAGPAYQAAEVWLRVRRVLAPGDSLVAQLLANSGGWPGGLLATSQPVSGSSLADELAWVRFPFAAPYTLAANTAYFLVIARTGANDPANYYAVSVDQGQGYSAANTLVWNGSGWAFPTPNADLLFAVVGVEPLTTQIGRMLSACGQFFSGARVDSAPGTGGRIYRDGRASGREEIEALLPAAGPGGSRLLARVEPDRTARVYLQPMPGASAAVELAPDGRLRRPNGAPLLPGEYPAGQWASLGDLAPAGLPGGLLPPSTGAAAAQVFVEQCAWSAERGVHMG